jgi:CheY-like chemotaxis protein
MSRPILAIDDSLTFRKFIGKALAQTPGRYDVTLASDGREGLKCAAEKKPELILLDFVLPDLSGDEVCAQLAAIPELADIPIVLMSSSVESIQATAANYPAVKGTIAKPFTPELLCDTVNLLMGAVVNTT